MQNYTNDASFITCSKGKYALSSTLHNYEMQNKANKAYLQEQNTK